MIQNNALAFSRPNPALANRLREALATHDRRRAEAMGVPAPASHDGDVSDLEAMLAPVMAERDTKAAEFAPTALANVVPAAIAAPAQPIKVRNFVNGRARSKPAHDAHFAQEGLAPVLDAAALFSAKASVGYPAPSLSSLSPAVHAYAQILADIAALRLSDPLKDFLREQARRQHEIANPEPRSKPASRWFTSAFKVQPAKQARPASWYALCDEARVEWFQAAITRLGPTMTITVNFRPDVEAQALAQPSAASFILKRLRHHLKKELGRDVSIEFVLEQTDAGRLHLHGTASFSEKEALRARRAMRKAGGEFVDKKSRQFQCKTSGVLNGGWAGYRSKDLALARPFQRDLFKGDRRRARQFQGEAIAATQDVRRLAKKIYEEARASFIGKLKSKDAAHAASGKQRHQSNLIVAPHFLSSTSIIGLTAGFVGLTQPWYICIGELQCSPSTTSPTTATPLSRTTWSTPPAAPAAAPCFALPASATTRSSSTRSIARRSTTTASSSRLRIPAACCRSGWPWRSSRTRSGTGASSSRGPPKRRVRPTTAQARSAAGP